MKKYNQKKLKKKIYFTGMLILLISTVLALPIWQLTYITVEKNKWYDAEEIIKVSSAQDKHVLSVSFKEIKNISNICFFNIRQLL